MPEIERKKHKREPGEEQDVIIKAGRFRLYFQNYYTTISLVNDLLIGGLYLAGSLINLFGGPALLGQLFYLGGGLTLLLRPILKIIKNFFVYNKEEYQKLIEKAQEIKEKQEEPDSDKEGNPEEKETNQENKKP